jgi:hypothetical protein
MLCDPGIGGGMLLMQLSFALLVAAAVAQTPLNLPTCLTCTYTASNAWCEDVRQCFTAADAIAVASPTSTKCQYRCAVTSNNNAPPAVGTNCFSIPASCSPPSATSLADSLGGSLSGLSSLIAGDFVSAAILAATLDPAQATLATASIATNFACAIAGGLLFLGLLFWCTRPACTTNCGCCAIGKKQDVGAWKKSAPLALGRARGATYLLLQGYALIGAGLAMTWSTFSVLLTLPFYGASGLVACALSGLVGGAAASASSTALCSGGTLMSAGSAVLYVALVFAVPAWAVAWVSTVRLRNVAHQASLPDSACCGNIPAATYVAATATLFALVGLIVAWVGYNTIMALIPASAVTALKIGPPPGGIAVILGFLSLLAGSVMLCLTTTALAAAPVPFVTGAAPMACYAVTGGDTGVSAGGDEGRGLLSLPKLLQLTHLSHTTHCTCKHPAPPHCLGGAGWQGRAQAEQQPPQQGLQEEGGAQGGGGGEGGGGGGGGGCGGQVQEEGQEVSPPLCGCCCRAAAALGYFVFIPP